MENTTLTKQMVLQRLEEMPRRKDPAQNPSVVFRAAHSLMLCPNMWEDLYAEYELRQSFYDSIKVPQNSVPQNGLISNPRLFWIFCRILMASQDDETADAIMRIVVRYYTKNLSNELKKISKRMFDSDGNPVDFNSQMLLEAQIIDNYACFLRDLFVYISEYIDKDLFTELVIQEAEQNHIKPKGKAIDGLDFIIITITDSIINEWNTFSTDKYMERSRLLASYSNESDFYRSCKEAVQYMVSEKKAGAELIALPKSDKRLHVIMDIWKENHDYTNIVYRPEDLQGQNDAFGELSDLRPDSEDSDEEEHGKRPIPIGSYISMTVAMLISMEDNGLMPTYLEQMQEKIPRKLGKEFVNRAFILAEQNGMQTRNDAVLNTQTKQFILNIIAEEFAREYMHRSACRLAAALSDECAGDKTKETEKTAETKEYAATRYEELLEENRELKKQLEKERSEKSGKTTAKGEIKELKALLSEREKEIQTLQEEAESLRQENEEILTLFDLENDAQEPLPVIEDEADVEKAIGEKRILVWGCRAEFIRKYDGRYSNITMIDTSERKSARITAAQVANYDGVIVQTNCCGHGMYNKVVSMLRNANMPYIHMRKHDNNDTAFMQSIISLCRKIEDERALKEGGLA